MENRMKKILKNFKKKDTEENLTEEINIWRKYC